MTEVETLIAELDDADEAYREFDDRIADRGESRVEAVADAHDRATDLLDRYAGRATGTGDFQAFVEFQGEFESLVEGLPEELPHRDAFERAGERLDKRRLSEDDFARVREMLAPAADVARLLAKRDDARERYRTARREIVREASRLDDRIAELERLRELGDADLDAPVEELRDPVEAYNAAVDDAFEAFRREESAREVIDFVAAAEDYHLVPFSPPPNDLREYLHTHDAGTEPIPTLLDYAGYSTSKLDHYVEDVGALKREVATRETYLARLDAEPLRMAWPPRPADELEWWSDEVIRLLDRFAPPEPIERLREIRDRARDAEWYERLRAVAETMAETTPAERERLASGDIERELETVRSRRERLGDALESFPDR